jgi:HSP20 family protein
MAQQIDRLIGGLPPTVEGALWVPDVDIEETDDAWIFEAEIPGAKSGDVNVELRENELSITGEIKQRERVGLLRRRTRRVGRFEFRVTLPGQVDAESIDASLDDGVLTVRVPKAEQSQPRRIEIHRGANGAAAGGGNGAAASSSSEASTG